jgi:hypothetical protein
METCWPTIDKISRMMEFLGIDYYTIPHYNLPMPSAAEGENYRPEKMFRLFPNGRMTYFGWGYVPRGIKDNITIDNLIPDQRYIDRAYIFLNDDVKEKIQEKTKFSGMKNIQKLLLKFNHLEFVDLS